MEPTHPNPQSMPLDSQGCEFTPVPGGLLYRILLRSRLVAPPLKFVRRRMLLAAAVTWLPLLVLSWLDGNAIGGTTQVAFLEDIAVHVRFLFALPLLISAEVLVHRLMQPVAGEFLAQGVVIEKLRPQLEAVIRRTCRLRDSLWIEVLIFGLAVTMGHVLWASQAAQQVPRWSALAGSAGPELTHAGFWYVWVCLPLFQFMAVLWYYRLFLWGLFLWRVARLDLVLIPTHPDGVGGLDFVQRAAPGFAPVLTAQAAVLSSVIAGRIFQAGARLEEFKVEILALTVILLLLCLGPLFFFTPRLIRARRRGLAEYGRLAARYVREFDSKWVHGKPPADEALVGSADIQSLADMDGSYSIIRRMSLVPFELQTIWLLLVAAVWPLLPLLLTKIPLRELMSRLVQLLL